MEPTRILLLAANPRDTDRLSLGKETSEIYNALSASKFSFDVHQVHAATTTHLRRELLKFHPHFVHFCGHGLRDGSILLEDDQGYAKEVSPEALAKFLSNFSSYLRCVVLNACYTRQNLEPIAKYVEWVITMEKSIEDRASILFSTVFYEVVAEGEEIGRAFSLARDSLHLEGMDEQYLRPHLEGPSYGTQPIGLEIIDSSATETNQGEHQSLEPDHEVFDSRKEIIYLLNTLKGERNILFVLGDRACQNGKQRGRVFPTLDETMIKILDDHGVDGSQHISERSQAVRKLLKTWEREKRLTVRVKSYLTGEPDFGFYFLAAFVILMLKKNILPLVISFNYDDLMATALSSLCKYPGVEPAQTISVRENISQDSNDSVTDEIDAHLLNKIPVVVKILGELASDSLFFTRNTFEVSQPVRQIVDYSSRWPLILIEHSFADSRITRLLIALSRERPIFLIGEKPRIPKDMLSTGRMHVIPGSLKSFANSLEEILQSRSADWLKDLGSILRALSPVHLITDLDVIYRRAKIASKLSLERAKERLPRDSQKRTIEPVRREETGPSIEKFLSSSRPILGIIGDSGTGKSTTLFLAATDEERVKKGGLYIPLFYDSHQLQSSQSFSDRIAQDFLCEKRGLEELFPVLQKLLTESDAYLVIFIDAINESTSIEPIKLRADIEDIASRLPRRIKIIFSCRRVYWDTYFSSTYPLLSELYYQDKEYLLPRFSHQEAESAFNAYQQMYQFKGIYSQLKPELKEKIRDPLMLRMLAEGYQGRRLPSFAPAVFIFKGYEDRLRAKLKNTVVMDFLKLLLDIKRDAFIEDRATNDQFIASALRLDQRVHNLILQQQTRKSLAGDPFHILEDEGILSLLEPQSSTYRFTYDRFFEYLLGKAFGNLIETSEVGLWSRLSELVSKFQNVHFSALEALKSEIIRQNIELEESSWSLASTKKISDLLGNRDPAVVGFIKDTLRELIFESLDDFSEIIIHTRKNLDSCYGEKLLLELTPDHPRAFPALMVGLFSGSVNEIRRSIQALTTLCREKDFRLKFEREFLIRIKNRKFENRDIQAVIYYCSLIFLLSDIDNEDPFPAVKSFWFQVLSRRRESFSLICQKVSSTFCATLRAEGPLFMPTNATCDGLDYIWTDMTETIRNKARSIAHLLIQQDEPFSEKQISILQFFGSELKNWNERLNTTQERYTYRLEYRISQWLLLRRSAFHFHEVSKILNLFSRSDNWLSVDFALCTMKFILQLIHPHDIEKVRFGFELMSSWVSRFEREIPEFFKPLSLPDPFESTFNALSQTARIDAQLHADLSSPISFLQERLMSGSQCRARMAVLSARHLWRDHPIQVIRTLDVVSDTKDDLMRDWVDRTLKEIYIMHPRLVEDYFWRHRIGIERCQSIKYREDIKDASGVSYFGDPLYKSLLLRDRQRRVLTVKWYLKSLTEYPDLESFCSDFVMETLHEILN